MLKTVKICTNLTLPVIQIWPSLTGSRCLRPPAQVVATSPHLHGPWVITGTPVDCFGAGYGVKITPKLEGKKSPKMKVKI